MSTETKWADVAHYYLRSGIKCNVYRGDLTERRGDCKHTVETFGIKHLRVAADSMTFGCVPILRHLDDMLPDFYDRTPSDEEDATADRICATLWDIAFPHSKEDRSCGVFEQKQNGMWMLRYGSERLFLHECGEMFADGGNGPIPFNAAAMVNFLTLEGFDIFGLIKSGQAIRKEVGNG